VSSALDVDEPHPFPPYVDGAELEHSLPRALPRRPGVMLGIFQPNEAWDFWPTTETRTTTWTYGHNRDVIRLAEAVGLSFAFPAGRWKGLKGSQIDWRGASIDTITLTAGLLEITERITLLTTMHTNVFNPVVAAKIGADLDHIGEGRWGLNIVSGWGEAEFRSMGIPLLNHKDRYAYTREWLDIVQQLWTSGVSSYSGHHLSVHDAELRPRPRQAPLPLIVNAGQSYTGMSFAAERADYLFSRGENATKFKDIADGQGSGTGFIGTHKVLVKPTTGEAVDLARRILAGVDREAVGAMRVASGAATPEAAAEFVADPKALERAVLENAFVGDPETVGTALAEWAHTENLDGICLTLFNYVEDLELLGAEVIPVLRRELRRLGSDVVLTTDR
jgi:pyrimidine oxygenase